MKKIKRESITHAAAEPCGTVPQYDPADTTDAALIEAERRFIAYRAWWCADESHYDDAECDRRGEITDAFQTFIAKTPAHTLAGVAVKLRGLYHDLGLDEGCFHSSIWTNDLILTAAEAVGELRARAGFAEVEPGAFLHRSIARRGKK
jgi:hypothetical protein